MTEQQWIARARHGDADAFEQLVVAYEGPVYRLALRMCGSTEDAREVTQDAFLAAWRGLPAFRGDSRFSSWLYRLTTNAAIDFLRREKHHLGNLPLEEAPERPDPQQPELLAEQREQQEALQRALDQLSPEHRQVLLLRVVQQLSYDEIAQALSLESGTVKSRISRARRQLREILLRQGELLSRLCRLTKWKGGVSMHCNQEQIEALLDGELVGPEQDAVLAHLRDCPGCRSYYRQLLAMEQALRADTDPVLDDLLPDIMNRVHATPQRRRRQPWLRAAMGMAACLVVVLGVYLVRYQVEKGSDSPFSGILPDSSANNSVGADGDTFTDEVTPSDGGLTFASGGTERQESSGPADYVLMGHPELAQQARQWLSQQGLEPDEDGIYPLTAQQVQGLNAAVPELELPTDDALRLLLED